MYRRMMIVLLLLGAGVPAAAKEETLDQLKEKAARASVRDQPKIFLELAERHLEAANTAYDAGEVEKGREAVEEVASYSEKAGNAAIQARKHMKQVEIKVRRMERKLSDIRRAVTFEDRASLEAAIQRMEKIRANLLRAMFGTDL
ncbi:MAG: hypothetical protein ACE14L_14045 [Terriglobales bacterium]